MAVDVDVDLDLEVREDFFAILPPLSDHELSELESMLVEDGKVRDAILYWNHSGHNWIVDGHHRFRIAVKHNLPFHTLRLQFADEKEAVVFINRNQSGRRNLTPDKLSYQRGQTLRYLAEDVSAKTIADQQGVSTRTLIRDRDYAEKLDKLSSPVRDAILNHAVPATSKEIDALVSLDSGTQQQIVRDVRVGNTKSLKESLESCGAIKKQPKKKKTKQQKEPVIEVEVETKIETEPYPSKETKENEQCPKGGDHQWISDGEGGTYCENCFEPQPGTERDWESLAELHRSSKKQIDTIRREFEKRASEPRGSYLKHQVSRLLKYLDDASALIRQHEPVDENDGEIITRIHREERKK